MRRRIIGWFLLFSAGLFFIANLFNLNAVLANTAPSYMLSALLAPLLTVPFSMVGSKIIIDDYNKHNWNVSLINTLIGGVLGFIYSLILILLVTQSWINTSNNISFAAEIPLFIRLIMVVFGVVIGGLLGWFSSTIGFVSLGLIISLGAVLGKFLSEGVTPIVLSMVNSFILNLFILSLIIGLSALFGKKNKINQIGQSDIANNTNLLDLLELAKSKQKALSKAEIMSELKLDIKTVDNLLKDAEINQLCSVQLDGENGTMKYNFDV